MFTSTTAAPSANHFAVDPRDNVWLDERRFEAIEADAAAMEAARKRDRLARELHEAEREAHALLVIANRTHHTYLDGCADIDTRALCTCSSSLGSHGEELCTSLRTIRVTMFVCAECGGEVERQIEHVALFTNHRGQVRRLTYTDTVEAVRPSADLIHY